MKAYEAASQLGLRPLPAADAWLVLLSPARGPDLTDMHGTRLSSEKAERATRHVNFQSIPHAASATQ